MEIDAAIFARVLAVVSNVVFMVMIPRVHRLLRAPKYLWILITSIEVAWLGQSILIVERIVNDDPWRWEQSPIWFVASVLGLIYVLRAEPNDTDPPARR